MSRSCRTSALSVSCSIVSPKLKTVSGSQQIIQPRTYIISLLQNEKFSNNFTASSTLNNCSGMKSGARKLITVRQDMDALSSASNEMFQTVSSA